MYCKARVNMSVPCSVALNRHMHVVADIQLLHSLRPKLNPGLREGLHRLVLVAVAVLAVGAADDNPLE